MLSRVHWGFLLIIAASFLWALDTLIRYPLIYQGMSAVNLVLIEHLMLSILFLALNLKSLGFIKKLSTVDWLSFFVVGGIGSALATVSFTKAFEFLNPSLVIILQKFQPIFAIMLAKIVLGEKVQSQFLLWALVCLVGVVLVSYPDLEIVFNMYLSTGEILPELYTKMGAYLLVLFSILGWGASTVFSKRLSLRGLTPQEIMTLRFCLGLLTLLPFYLFTDLSLSIDLSLVRLGQISLMVIISGVLAMALYYQGLKRVDARYTTLGEMFFPMMAIFVNWIFLDQTLVALQLVGVFLLVFGAIVVQWKKY